MNAFNRIVMLIIALLLVAVPVFLLLVAFGVVSAGLINSFTNYQGGLQALGNLISSGFSLGQGARIITAIVGAILALVALLLLLRELSLGHRVARSIVMDDTPGRETKITAGAVRSLAEGAARDVGAESPSVSLRSEGRPYRVLCDIRVPGSSNVTQTATRTRESIQQTLEGQQVPVKDVEVTVQGITS